MKKKLIFVVSAVITMVGVILFGVVRSSVNIKDEESLSKFIAKQDHVNTATILKTATKDDYFAALYTNGKTEQLIILEKNLIGRYQYFGGGNNSQDIATYNYNQGNSWSLIIVYGDNRNVKADSYEFENKDKKYGNINLEDYILDIYIIEDTNIAASSGVLLDEKGNKVGTL